MVVEDQELQDFVKDIYVYGMRGKKASGKDHATPSSLPVLSSALPFSSDFPWATLACGIHLATSMLHGDISGTFCSPESPGHKHQDTGPSCCFFPVCLAHAGPSSTSLGEPREGPGWGWGSAGWVSFTKSEP